MSEKLHTRARRLCAWIACVAAWCLAGPIARADYTLIKTVDLAGLGDVGNNPLSITFDGTTYAYVGGYNGSGQTRLISILKVNLDDPDDRSVLTAATETVGAGRYYHGLVYRNDVLFALLDRPDGTVENTSIRAIFTGNGSLVGIFDGDDLQEPGDGIVRQPAGAIIPLIGGLAYDPGFEGADAGLAFFGLGSGRRLLIHEVTGVTLYNTSTGLITFGSGFPDGSSWRDVVFDDNGDIYQRRTNQVQRAIRSGGNSISAIEPLTDALTEVGDPLPESGDGKPISLRKAPNVIGQNLALLKAGEGAGPDDLVIFNDRPNPPAAGTFAGRIKIMRKDGSLPAEPPRFLRPDGTAIDSSDTPDSDTSIYDFHYDPPNDLLLVLDFSNRRLYVFQGPQTPAACCLPSGACTSTTRFDCLNLQGQFHPGMSCDGVSCPQPCPDPFADADRDGDVDQDDFGIFQACMTGPGASLADECECFDRDGNLAVDLADYSGSTHNSFLACVSGPAVSADATCDD